MFTKACCIGLFLISLFGLLCWNDMKSRPSFSAGPSPALTPEEELSTFQTEPGLAIQLVASEPMVEDPVVTIFDADGRLWVVEMRGFMPNLNGEGEKEPIGRISVLEDLNGDGKMDRSTVYLDSLIMPRAIALVPGGALVAENGSLWLTQDINGDLKSDTKLLIDSAYAGSPLPEHSGNGLWRGMDNWYYNAKSRFRYRLNDGKWLRDSTEFRGQWGICHDNEGRLMYNYNWSQLHADLVPPNYLSRNKNHSATTGVDYGLTLDRRVYPIRSNPAVNRGYIPGTLDKDGRLLEFTAACSPLCYRGTALPKEYSGNVFVCEPAGNLVKRNVVEETGFTLSAHDPHPGREFLASTDERFRPVYLSTGPDGALYVADMYRGVLQHAAYITPYLKDQSIRRDLVLPVHKGRIWRIIPKNWQQKRSSNLSSASPPELVQYLSDQNGWIRDMAQRLLVERKDHQVKSALMAEALKGNNTFGRMQALWTLDGLKLNNATVLFQLASDKDPLISNTALRLLEPFATTDPKVRNQLGHLAPQLLKKADLKQLLQISLTAGVLDPVEANPILATICAKYGDLPLIRDAVLSSIQNREFAFLRYLWTSPQWQAQEAFKEIFVEMLASAIIAKRNTGELNALLALLNGKTDQIGWRQKAVLTGLAISRTNNSIPVKLTTPPIILQKAVGKIEPGRLALLNTLFDWSGHKADKVNPVQKIALSDDQQKQFVSGRQHFLTTCAGCHGTDGLGMKRFAPPLSGSEWVLGDERRLALLVLYGMEGPVQVAGKKYDAPEILPVMPAHSTMDDAAITAILTYIRNEWGNNAGAIGKGTVGTTRVTSQGRVVPWKADELKNYVVETKSGESK